MKLPKRLLIALVCFGLAAVLFFVGIPILRSGTAKTVTAVRAAVPIAKGERIEETQIRFEEIGAYGLQDGVLTDPGRAIGAYAAADLFAGDLLTEEKVSATPISSRAEARLEEGSVGVTVTLDSLEASLANRLEVGNIVTVYDVSDSGFRESSDSASLTRDVRLYPELLWLQVALLTDEDGTDLSGLSPYSSEPNPICRTVTFFVSPRQAQVLLQADRHGTLHLTLVSRGDPDRAGSLLLREKALLATLSLAGEDCAKSVPLEDLPFSMALWNRAYDSAVSRSGNPDPEAFARSFLASRNSGREGGSK